MFNFDIPSLFNYLGASFLNMDILIKRLVLEIETIGLEDPAEAMAEARECLSEWLYPVLEEELGHLENDVQVEIERIEVNLGELPESELRDTFRAALREELRRRMEASRVIRGNIQEGGSLKIRRYQEALLQYLKTGYTDSSAQRLLLEQGMASPELERELLSEWGRMFPGEIVQQCQDHPAALARFTVCCPPALIPAAIASLTDHLPPKVLEAVKAITGRLVTYLKGKPGELPYVRQALQLALQTALGKEPEEMTLLRLEELKGRMGLGKGKIIWPQSWDISSASQERASAVAEVDNPLLVLPDITLTEGRISVPNAGMVLLHPFLPSLFQRLGFTDANGKFSSPSHQVEAVWFVHGLAGDGMFVPDFHLPLSKLLCGLYPGHPVLPFVPYANAWKKEAKELLTAVIGHWSVLKRTSPKGLQEGFLKRNGLLEPNGRDWILRVEPQGYDILLDHIPWGYGVVRPPWNECNLYVEWKRA